MREVLRRTPRFVERVFTPRERAYCDGRGAARVAAQHYAARFAAKEAMLKALSTGWSGGVAWQDIERYIAKAGAPCCGFTDAFANSTNNQAQPPCTFPSTYKRTRHRSGYTRSLNQSRFMYS